MGTDDTTTTIQLEPVGVLRRGGDRPGASTRAGGAVSAVTAPRKPAWQTRKMGYQPALDGLRAVAVGW